ncbi:MAG TPA: UDP-N-acetylglucosamine--N-acetylmuramyl-(pentapeptide) pyrophosphoryl-undecaprenol N-acetylglucosamine transferase [Patescibacteria group bacterium]|nr:UDP-N-acetylglucosamine--N-acetylmuramyl-(pentapeptide) pyrophosphoryl-undecaprenol N-acetylglucosamine transferase [Patescibacteria group bacterium]
MSKKLFITGGHLTPAIAVIDEITEMKLPWEIVFVGRMHPFEGSYEISQEQLTVETRHIRFISLTTGRLQRMFTFQSIVSLAKVPYGFIQAFVLFFREKPDAVISFGGYIALPIVVSGYFFGIPIITHEQTRRPGIANKIISYFAQKICLSFPDTTHTFPKEKTIVTGLPIRKNVLCVFKAVPITSKLSQFPLIYITGGSTGSVSLNDLVFPLISSLAKKYTIIHQTGKASFMKAKTILGELPADDRKRYITRDYIDESFIGWILHNASLVISRSGANTVTELSLLHKKAILIPLPWSGGAEQLDNALWFTENENGVVLDQKKLTSTDLHAVISKIMSQSDIHKHTSIHTIVTDGAKQMVRLIQELLL